MSANVCTNVKKIGKTPMYDHFNVGVPSVVSIIDKNIVFLYFPHIKIKIKNKQFSAALSIAFSK